MIPPLWQKAITSWQVDGETMETVTAFIFLGSKITVDGDCSHKIKRHLLLERKAVANLDNILKSRDIILSTKVHLSRLWFSQQMWVGLWRKLNTEEFLLLNCGVGEDSWESLGLQGDPASPSWRKPTLNIRWKDWCSSSYPFVTWCEELTHWKRPLCWGRLRAGGEVGNRLWDGWMGSSTQGK